MKKFQFRLDGLRRYRNMLFEQEQARLQELLRERDALEARRRGLENEMEESRQRILGLRAVSAEDLAALHGFRRYVDAEGRRIDEAQSRLGERIAHQRAAMHAERRRVEALDGLKERRLETWRKEVDKETEQAVAELVIARFRRP